MVSFEVHEALYLHCEIHGPRFSSFGSRAWQICSYIENVVNKISIFFSVLSVVGDKVMHFYYAHNVRMLNCEINCPGHGTKVKAFYWVWRGGGGLINTCMINYILKKYF